MNGRETRAEDYVRPSLIDTAELAYELTSQDWSEIGSPDAVTNHNAADDPFGFESIESYADDILALLLIRFLAILQQRSNAPKLPKFRDLSTTTICRSIMADEARRTADPILVKEMDALDWPEVLSDEVVYLLRSYIIQILSLYRGVFYHNCAHAHHVFLSANKLLDMMLCEHKWESVNGKGIRSKKGDSEFGIIEEKQSSLDAEDDNAMYIENLQQRRKYEISPKKAQNTL